MTVEELQIGNYYWCQQRGKDKQYVFKYDNDKFENHRLILDENDYHARCNLSSYNTQFKGINYRLATPSEKRKLDTCIKAGRYVDVKNISGFKLLKLYR